MSIQTLVPEATVEALDEGILDGLPGIDKLELNLLGRRPLVEPQTDQFLPVVEHHRVQSFPFRDQLVEYLDHPGTGH